MCNGSRGKKPSAEVIGDTREETVILREKFKSSVSQESVVADRRAVADKIRHAKPVGDEVDHAKLTGEIIARFPKILSELAK
jgi:hypothetical protein